MTTKLPRRINRGLSVVAITTALTIGGLVASAGATDTKGEISIEQVIERLKKQGYSDISDVEREGDRYCADVRDSDGKKFEVHVSAKTGEIVGKEPEDD